MDERVFFIELMRTQYAHGGVSRAGFAKLDITEGVPKVLYLLKVNEGCVQKELARLCQVKESTLTVMLKKLEQRGFIRKERLNVSGGKRAFGIYLTDEGHKKAESVYALTERIDSRCLEGFSEDEKNLFYSFMERVRNNLEGFEV